MNKFLDFLKGIRFVNLTMIFLVQWIVSVYFVQSFNYLYVVLISVATIFIALAAYLLNDIADVKIDSFNKKLKLISEDNKGFWLKLVVLFNCIGLGLGFYVSVKSQLMLFLYFVLAVVLLSFYALYLSKFKPLGNLLISFLIALSILLCFYLELHHSSFTRVYYSSSVVYVWLYAFCAFLLNWVREVVKDIEDIEGDKLVNRISIPIAIGLKSTKLLVAIVLVFFAIIYVILAFNLSITIWQAMYYVALALYVFLILFYLFLAKNNLQFKALSFKIKVLMFVSVVIPVIYS